jgi:hypothetical protein
MLQAIYILTIALSLIGMGSVVAVCLILYRRLPLPSFPWLAAYCAIEILAILLSRHIVGMFSDPGHGSTVHSLALWSAGLALGSSITHLLVITLILSEIVYFTSQHYPGIKSELFSFLLLMRKYVTPLGVALVSISLLPVVIDLVLLARGS